MFKSINRVLLCLIQLLTEGVNLSVSQICAMKLRFPLRQAGVDSDLVQNIWVIIWWVGARGPTRLGNSEFTQIFWVFPVYIADFWQTFWVIWENGSNWSNLRLKMSFFALGRLKNHKVPHLHPNSTMFMPLDRLQLKIYAFSGKFNVCSKRVLLSWIKICRDFTLQTQIFTQKYRSWLRFYSEFLRKKLAAGGSACNNTKCLLANIGSTSIIIFQIILTTFTFYV